MNQLLQHSAALLTGRAVERGGTLLVLLAAALRLGPDALGPVLAVLSAGTLTATLSGAGLRRLCLVAWPRTPADERPALVNRLVGQQLVLLGLGGLGLLLLAPWLPGSPALLVGAWAAAALYELAELLRAPFLARGQPGPDTWLPGLTRLGLLAGVLLAGPALDAPTLVGLYAGSQLAGTLLAAWLLAGLLPLRPRPCRAELAHHARRALAHVVPPSLAVLCCHGDVLVLAGAGSPDLAGYALLTRLTLVTAALSGAACSVLLPAVPAHLAAGHPARVRRDLTRLGQGLALVFGPISLALAWRGGPLLAVLLDGRTVDPLLVGGLAALLPLTAALGLAAQTLEAAGQLGRVLSVAALVLVLDTAADLALVPLLGARGAALSTLLSLGLGLTLLGRSLVRASWWPRVRPRPALTLTARDARRRLGAARRAGE